MFFMSGERPSTAHTNSADDIMLLRLFCVQGLISSFTGALIFLANFNTFLYLIYFVFIHENTSIKPKTL